MTGKLPRIPLDQWVTFKTVVDRGSFALAAETLNKSQSSVSYAIARLNEQLPQPLLRLEGRKAVLTAEGDVLYRYANQLIRQAQTLEDVAHSMAVAFEAEVTIALDVLLEISVLCRALESFSRRFPHTRVRILETSLSGTVEAMVEKKAGIVIGATVPVGHAGKPLCSVQMIPVAAPAHPVFRETQPVSEMTLKSFRQVVLRDTGQRSQQDAGWLAAEQRWTVSHFHSSISLLKAGLGFGFLPRNWVLADIVAGYLREIPMANDFTRTLPMYLMQSAPDSAGPATRALVDELVINLRAQQD